MRSNIKTVLAVPLLGSNIYFVIHTFKWLTHCIVFVFAIRKYCIKGEPSLCDRQHIDSYIGSMKISHMIAGLVQGMNI